MKLIILACLFFASCTPEALDFSLVSKDASIGNDGGVNNGVNNDVNNGQADGGANNGQADMGTNNGQIELTGEQIYKMKCFVCHGDNGEGGAVWAGSIQGFSDISPAVKDGVGTMDSIAMSDAEIVKVQAFLDNNAPANPDGKVIYAQECAGCHGKDGKGLRRRGFQLRYKDDGYSTFQTRTGRSLYAFSDSPNGMPAFTDAQVSDTHLNEMWDWLNSLPNESTDEGLYLQFCGNCHGVDGRAIEVERNIDGATDFNGDVRNGHNAGQYDARTRFMSKWDASQISDQELSQITSHVSQL